MSPLPNPENYPGQNFRTLSGYDWEKCYTVFSGEEPSKKHYFWRIKEGKRMKEEDQ